MNAVAEINRGGAVTTGFDPFAAYGEEASRGGSTFLKFSKGEWLLGQDENTDHAGRRFAARMEGLMIGWVHWKDKRPDDRRMGLLVDGHRPESRQALGDTDEADWPTDAEGRPQDPWQKTNELPLADPETGEQVLFSASSTGGIGAIGNLCKAYGREYRLKEGKVPVVELGVDSYRHPTYGKVKVPVLTIVDWIDNDGVPQPAAADGDEPEEKPAAQKAAGSKTRF